jgi:hypothetical protein
MSDFNGLNGVAYAACLISLAVAEAVADSLLVDGGPQTDAYYQAIEAEEKAFLCLMRLDGPGEEHEYQEYMEPFNE